MVVVFREKGIQILIHGVFCQMIATGPRWAEQKDTVFAVFKSFQVFDQKFKLIVVGAHRDRTHAGVPCNGKQSLAAIQS